MAQPAKHNKVLIQDVKVMEVPSPFLLNNYKIKALTTPVL